ncbi:MAG: SDR family NAD(P)-dependent oxidoreductase [Candidatus Bathyarchaeota archaeon]|nr:SDR family NAD(P)-dependent oxidoreductase [Candidatus Bathyarchaeota archaeon]
MKNSTKDSTILVTGGAGFIGSHLVSRLVELGYRVVILDNLYTGKLENLSSVLRSGLVDFVKGDITDQMTVKQCVTDADCVIHLAAQTSVPFSVADPDFNNKVNIDGSRILLEECVSHSVKKFVFVSSCAVYGDPTYLPLDEHHPTNPISPYAESKRVIEKECLRLNAEHLLNSVVLRFFNVYGARQGLNDYSGVITKFMDRIKSKQSLVIYGDGSQTRDFVYVEDIVNSIVLAYESSTVLGEIFNVGSGVATSIEELAQTMLRLTGANSQISYLPYRPGEIRCSYANISKANELLGYKPQFLLPRGLRDLLSWNGLLSS